MKTFRNLVMFFVCLQSGANAMGQAHASDPEVVKVVDLKLYSGTWFDIAHNPNFFQKKCLHSTAEYSVLSPVSLSVYNECFKAQGETSDIRGTATVVDPKVAGKLKVKFNLIARGDYWITALDSNYQWAIVSGPKKKSLFILSRSAPMNPSLLQKILSDLKAQGFKTEALVFDQY
jgi:apolipoprotein D and lipocalin family protein